MKKKTTTPQTTTRHRNRRAIVYRRQSTPLQMEETGSASHQAAQRRFARGWGWPASAIEIIDEAPGGNGYAMKDRPGYEHLCQLIARGDVGLVMVSDASRITRSRVELERFFDLCRRGDTLVAVDGKLVQPREVQEECAHRSVQDELMLEIMWSIAKFEASRRRHHVETTGDVDPAA